jgi:hypothetical protein
MLVGEATQNARGVQRDARRHGGGGGFLGVVLHVTSLLYCCQARYTSSLETVHDYLRGEALSGTNVLRGGEIRLEPTVRRLGPGRNLGMLVGEAAQNARGVQRDARRRGSGGGFLGVVVHVTSLLY